MILFLRPTAKNHCRPPRRFYLLTRTPFCQMDKYTFISLYHLHVVPAQQLFHLNQYFLILENKCSIKNLLGYLTVFCAFFFYFNSQCNRKYFYMLTVYNSYKKSYKIYFHQTKHGSQEKRQSLQKLKLSNENKLESAEKIDFHQQTPQNTDQYQVKRWFLFDFSAHTRQPSHFIHEAS